MKIIIPAIALSAFLYGCSNSASDNHEEHQPVAQKSTSPDTSKKSIPSETKKRIGNTDVTIKYHAPAVRGRVIWGGLVPFNTIWVTGAHSATTLEVGKPFQLGDKLIPAGKYALFTIPGEQEWTVIINKNWDQHLADEYAQDEDVQRIVVKPQRTEQVTERLKYEIDQTGESTANVIIHWEKLSVPFQIEIRN